MSTLSKKYFGGVTAHYLYAHAQPGYVRKLDLSSVSTKIHYYQLKELIFAVSGMETDARRFDKPGYQWYDRKSFSNMGLGEKGKIISILDEVIQGIKSDTILVLADNSKQTELIASLEILSSTAGIFDKIKIPLTKGNETAKRFINDPGFLRGDSNILNPLFAGANQGLLLWKSLRKLGDFINGEVFAKSSNAFKANGPLEKAKLSGILEEIASNANHIFPIILKH